MIVHLFSLQRGSLQMNKGVSYMLLDVQSISIFVLTLFGAIVWGLLQTLVNCKLLLYKTF